MIDKFVPVVSYGTNFHPFYFSIPHQKLYQKKKISPHPLISLPSIFPFNLSFHHMYNEQQEKLRYHRSFSKRILFHSLLKKSQFSINSRKEKKADTSTQQRTY